DPRFQGSLQAIGGVGETMIGATATLATGGIAAVAGWPVMVHGLDQTITGVRQLFTNHHQQTVTEQALQKAGMSPESSALANTAISIFTPMGVVRFIQVGSRSMTFIGNDLNPYASSWCDRNMVIGVAEES